MPLCETALRLSRERYVQLERTKPDKYWQKFFFGFFLIAPTRKKYNVHNLSDYKRLQMFNILILKFFSYTLV